MFHFKNEHIKVTNHIVRKPKSLQWVPIMMCATQLNPNQLHHYITALPVRAREHQITCTYSYAYRVLRYDSTR